MSKEIKLIGEVDQEQIQKWKGTSNQTIHGIIVDGHICYVKKPDRKTVSYALSQMSYSMSMDKDETDKSKMEMSMNMGKMMKQGEAVITQCWLGGSEEIRNNVDLYTAACMKAGELIEIKEAEIKNF
ncbi:hypothetical protein [Dysgonomonas sp. 520]|uniref:hypothetical protein n=1 Tax=Dysgonomonas sp. 520 TaxID=2302931 RepID=UPI0013CFAEC7|nr:hypothetical protein [Dysgonomonas sp. 520]NDW10450.1 hypothetical protein [Dysgonomonas sp. 520]